MKKIGIITLNGEFNYGNRLQNFALQKVLESNQVQVDTIVIKKNKVNKLRKVLWIGGIHNLSDLMQMIKKNVLKLTPTSIDRRKNYRAMQAAKWKTIAPFTKTNIHTLKIDEKYLAQLQTHYDLFIVGSDQVWNPNIIEFDPTYFLAFAPQNKRYSYSASFGVDTLPQKPALLKVHYRDYLKQMNYISVREASGAKVVEELIGKKAEVAPDPTLLLSQEEWVEKLALTIKETEKTEKFLLIYFVSEISPEMIKEIKKFAKDKQLNIVHIMGDTFGSKRIIVDPKQFVAMIANAQYVFTDSFHGSVFSIIMQTPFFVYERTDHKGTYTRIENLTEQFFMRCALVSLGDDLAQKETMFDFELAKKLLAKERERGRKLLQQKILTNDFHDKGAV